MTIFDQRNQQVSYQYNAAGDINFGAVQNRMELITELEKLKVEIARAGEARVIDAEVVTDADDQIAKAIQQAKKPTSEKQTVLGHLKNAKELVEDTAGGVTAATGLVTALTKAAELAQTLF